VRYTYSGVTGANEVYIYAFGVAFGNECFEAWDFMNSRLEAAMPSLQQASFELEGERMYDSAAAYREP